MKQIHRFLHEKPDWLNRRFLLLTMTLMVFTMAMAWGEPIPQGAAMFMGNQEAAIPITSQVQAQPVVDEPGLPPELVMNRDQTNGVLLGGSVLIMIIIGGTISAFHHKWEEE